MKSILGKFTSLLILLSIVTLSSFAVHAESIRNTKAYNIANGVGLKGYDPVSYFPEGGSNPQKGLSEFKLDYMGVTYLFSSAKSLDIFVENPDKYEPTYGGWCAFAMASGTKVDIQPSIYTLQGNRLHFFVSKRAKQNFDSDLAAFELRADKFWEQLSGEKPRL